MTRTSVMPPRVLTVSQLTHLIQGMLEATFHSLWVGGEVAEAVQAQSGHVYFTLKDEGAQIRCVMWRSTASRLRFQLQEGQQLVCHGDIDVFPPRGSYQLVVNQIEVHGQGALQLAFKQLQQRLAAEGLFDPRHKKPLPAFPRRVGLITSPTGAAVHDFLEVARRRYRGVSILVIPVRVQGAGSADEIAQAVRTANRLKPQLDVLVVGRGGGSLEDLWSFNEEVVVRAIFASQIPVVSAVGHEIDVTLADLVADVRALTPSEAAERVIPSADELANRLAVLRRRMVSMLRARADAARRHVEQLSRSRVLQQPESLVYDLFQRLDDLHEQLARAIRRNLNASRERLATLTCHMDALSPLAVLARGYSITTDFETGAVVRSPRDAFVGQRIQSRVWAGSLISRIEETAETGELRADTSRS